jgi:ArsR family transcriptional regulator
MTSLCIEIENFGKGIGNASRYQIIQALLKGQKTVNQIVKIVGLSQPAVSQHLKCLKTFNLVVDERKGQEVYYSVNTEHMLELLKSMTMDVKKCPDTVK